MTCRNKQISKRFITKCDGTPQCVEQYDEKLPHETFCISLQLSNISSYCYLRFAYHPSVQTVVKRQSPVIQHEPDAIKQPVDRLNRCQMTKSDGFTVDHARIGL